MATKMLCATTEPQTEFHRGCVVWARSYGLPWWPAQVRSLRVLDETEPTIRVRYFATNDSHRLPTDSLAAWHSRKPADPEQLQIKSKSLKQHYRRAVLAAEEENKAQSSGDPVEEVWSDDMEADDEEEEAVDEEGHDVEGKEDVPSSAENMGNIGGTRSSTGVGPDKTRKPLVARAPMEEDLAHLTTPQLLPGKSSRRKSPTKDELIQQYARGSMVWAKIHGFPWWPSQVRANRQIHDAEPRVRVRFWFTNDDATLPMDKLALWSEREPEDPTKMKIKSKSVIKQYGQALTLALAALEAGAVDEVWSDDQEEAEEDAEPGSADAELELLRSRSPKRPAGARPLYTRGSLVWAKIYGFPWWPSQVCSIRELYHSQPRVGIRFCYTGEEQTLLLEQLMPWASREPQDPTRMRISSNVMRTRYRKALEEARGMATKDMLPEEDEGKWSDGDDLAAEQRSSDQLQDATSTARVGGVVVSMHHSGWFAQCDDARVTPAPTKRKRRTNPVSSEPFARGSLVWAKIFGFPWWPSQVRSNKQIHDAEPRVRVRFWFTNDDATLPMDKLVLWSEREPEDPTKMKIKSKSVIKQYGQALTLALAALEAGVADEEWSDDQEEAEEDAEPGSADAELELLRSRSPKRPAGARPLYARGSLVWAKIYGFPWWPSQVCSIRELYHSQPRVGIRFCYTGEEQTLLLEQLVPWASREPQAVKAMTVKPKVKKDYARALEEARGIAAEVAENDDREGSWSDHSEVVHAAQVVAHQLMDVEPHNNRGDALDKSLHKQCIYDKQHYASLKRGDLAWVKLSTYPWWPSQVLRACHAADGEPELHVVLLFTNDQLSLRLMDDNGTPTVVPWNARKMEDNELEGVKSRAVKQQYRGALDVAMGKVEALAAGKSITEEWSGDEEVDKESDNKPGHSGQHVQCGDAGVTPAPTKRQKRTSAAPFSRGSMVWAKIHGFPWWPSQVRSTKKMHDAEPRVRVRFWFTNDDATLPMDKLALWSEREPEDPTKMKIKSKSVIKQYGQALTLALAALEAGVADEEWSDDQEEAEEDAEPGSADAELELLRSRSPKRPAGARPLYARGSLVWAKIYGFPWWPSQVCSIRELYHSQPRVGVRFCYTREEQTLLLEQLVPWASREPQAVKAMTVKPKVKKDYARALEEARGIAAAADDDLHLCDDELPWADDLVGVEEELGCNFVQPLFDNDGDVNDIDGDVNDKSARDAVHSQGIQANCRDSRALAAHNASFGVSRGDLVWVKLRCFPWWPSQVRSTRYLQDSPQRLRVKLLYTNDNYTLPLFDDNGAAMIARWEEHQPKPHLHTCKPTLRKQYYGAVELAQQLIELPNIRDDEWSSDLEDVCETRDVHSAFADALEEQHVYNEMHADDGNHVVTPMPTKRKKRKSSPKDELTLQYARGALVWAKIYGFPWWPSQVRANRQIHDAEPRVRVRFWFTNDDATLPMDKLALWSEREPEDPTKMKIKSKSVIKQYGQALTLALAALEAGVADEEWSDDQEEAEEDAEPGSADAELELLRSRSPKRPAGARPLYARGSLVWAKIYGFPWWPSQVCSIRELYHSQPRVGVRFCYTGEEQTLLLEQLMPWASREPQDPTRMRISSNVMRTRYRKALTEAQKIFATAKFDEKGDGAAERACEKTTRHRVQSGGSRAPCVDLSSPYARGSLVWAKIYGFPWWPSQVRSTRALNDEVPALRIRMLHTNDNLTLPLNQLKLWDDYEGRDPESIGSKKKKKKVRVEYRSALELAMKMASTAVHGNTEEEVWSDDMDESVNADDDTDCDEPDSTEQESNVTRKAQACAAARRAPCKTQKGTVEAQTTDHGPFSRGSLVWTKIHGFPWWPSRVFSAEHLNDAEPSLQVVLLYTEEHVQLNLTCPKGKSIFVPWDARAPEDPKSVKRQSVRTQYANAIQIARAMAAASADEGGAEEFGSDSEQNDEDDVSAAPRRRGWKRGRSSGNPNKDRAEQHAPLRPKAKRKDSGREGWVGPCESVGAEGERFYEAIRIAGEVFHVGDDVVVKASEGHVNELWACKIEGFWESRDGERLMDCRWYYTPEETRTGRLPGHDRREIFESVVTEENPVGVISAPCRVLSWSAYQRWLEEEIADDDEDDEEVFVCRAKYQPGTGEFLPLTGNSCLAEVARIGTFHKRIEDERPQGESHTPGAEVARKQPELPTATISQVQARRSRLGRFAEAAARLLPSAAPERMPCRERERAEVINALRAALLEGTLGSSLYLSGTPGTGKTATVHQALRELAADDSLPSFRTIEVNAMKLSSAYQVYSLLWQALTGQAVTPQKALGSLERCFSTSPGKRKRQTEKLIMVLDEIDYLVTRKQSVIYNMFDWATSAGSSLIIVGISNTMDLPERLLPRVHSRLGIRRINFLPYSYEDIITIIQDRLGGLIAFHADGLELCCRKVASVTGDVRRALEICRQAAQIAEREEADIVDAGGTPEPNSVVSFGHINAAVKQLKGSVAQRALQCAPMHHQLILACFILLQASTGRSEVLAEVLLQRHSDLCRTLGSNKVSQPTDAEQRECISRLCSSKILAVTETYGSIRLVVQPEDVRVMAREHPLVSQLFTH